MTTKKSMVFHTNIEKDTLENKNYRKVINTTTKQQLVLMSLKPGEDIECEIHKDVDQFFRIEKGNGELYSSLEPFCKNPSANVDTLTFKDGDVFVIPAGTYHRIKNTSNTDDLKLYTIYTPPNHPPNRLDVTRPVETMDEMKGGGMMHKQYIVKVNKSKRI